MHLLMGHNLYLTFKGLIGIESHVVTASGESITVSSNNEGLVP